MRLLYYVFGKKLKFTLSCVSEILILNLLRSKTSNKSLIYVGEKTIKRILGIIN